MVAANWFRYKFTMLTGIHSLASTSTAVTASSINVVLQATTTINIKLKKVRFMA